LNHLVQQKNNSITQKKTLNIKKQKANIAIKRQHKLSAETKALNPEKS
jgi:hypothetical protein